MERCVMNESGKRIELLIGRLDRTRDIIQRQQVQYRDFIDTDFPLLGRKTSSAMILAEHITDYCTCLETLFLRISQFFENNLDSKRWHSDLVEKMTLRILGIREPVLSEKTYCLLLELMKFRHFRHYYFEMEYDWDKLDYLQRKFEALQTLVADDLDRFKLFLERLR